MGLKNLFKRFMPKQAEIRNHRHLSLFGKLLHEPELWHITRHSAAGGMANGLFFAFMPVPGQMLLAAAVAIKCRINLPISILAVWLTNPVTFYPIFFAAYKTGSFILNLHPQPVHFAMTWEWVNHTLVEIWQPLLLGCVILGGISALCGYFAIRMLWRFAAVRKWEVRKERNRMRREHMKDKR